MADVRPAPNAPAGSIDREDYERRYQRATTDPEGYWRDQAKRLDWITPFERVKDVSFHEADFRIRWFDDGELNVSANCLDRHLATRGDQPAIIWEGDEPGESRTLTYRELHALTCRFANVLKDNGVAKGDRVTLYLPMVAEAAAAMLACTRIGAIHSIVFGGFSPDSLANRIQDCDSKLVITADEGCRGGKRIPLKANVDAALEKCPGVERVLVLRRTHKDIAMTEGRDLWLDEALAAASEECAPEPMAAEDPLFILYTSGSTGKPKGVLHTTAGYLLWVTQTFRDVFDYRDGEIFWCTADIGWVTGHSYVVYGPMATGATSFIYEGTPTYPKPDRMWHIVEKFKINTFYTAPTLIRALMRDGEEWPKKHDISCLRLLGTVGEPINPEAWMWYHRVIGREKCPIVDTWWQTETGGHLITPLPGAVPTKPGSATLPFPGIELIIVNADGKEVDINEGGYLCIKKPWPGIMRTIYGDHEKFKNTYFSRFPNMYFTGDGARKDEDGYYWIMGRIDDVLNVSGHRIGTAEVESALVSNSKVAEAAVVGIHHEIKGQGIYAFVTLKHGEKSSKAVEKELKDHVRKVIGPIASPDKIQFAEGLPKTRSGKIMRRILVKIANGDVSNLGDITTLADPSVVETLVHERV
ncbi:acetate--CoA ligase [Sphingomonas sp. UBA4815]|uniref:acetate--CoA ligase n=1 Tax=Sphingomonas sp. UBA4815 TaxID=1947533 RepID=UPI0031F487A5